MRLTIAIWMLVVSALAQNTQFYGKPVYYGQLVSAVANSVDGSVVGLWTLDEASGTTAFDSSSLTNNGVYTNSPVRTNGFIGTYARDFESTSGLIIPSNGNTPTNFTISFFVRPHTLGTLQYYYANRNGGSESCGPVFFWYQGRMNFWSASTYDSGGGSWDMNLPVPSVIWQPNVWYGVVTTWKSGQQQVFVNGICVAQTNYVGSVLFQSGRSWQIGNPSDGSFGANADVDNIQIWNRVLTTNEIQNIYSWGAQTPVNFVTFTNQPVIAKGGSYDGWPSDALAAPSWCYDGTNYVAAVSIWSNASNKWASIFFRSTNALQWSYITNSIIRPVGTDYIAGNGGIEWYKGKYFFTFNHYPQAGPSGTSSMVYSTNLTNWITITGSLPFTSIDNELYSNSITGDLELWSLDGSRNAGYATTTDGTNWSAWSTVIANLGFPFGEPSTWYDTNGLRRVSYDMNGRVINQSYQIGSSWGDAGMAKGPTTNYWENVQVFDNSVRVYDLGDGRGKQPWMLYAGSTNNSTTDDTQSSIGIATPQ